MAQRKLHDRFFKQAKAEGYLARSAYKLQEIQEKKRILRPGARVLDLGCSPGSWLQVAAEAVGPGGTLVGVDLQPLAALLVGKVHFLQADIFKVDPDELLGQSRSLFDVVLSDMAPSTTGHGDDFLSVRLCRRVLELLPPLLRPGGNLAMKVLEGIEFPALLKETQALFRDTRGFKPQASRDVSREMYIIGMGFKPPPRPVQ